MKITARTGDISYATIFKIRVGRRSGPDALDGFKLRINFSMPRIVNSISGIGVARGPSRSGSTQLGSLVNTDSYRSFRALAFADGSLKILWWNVTLVGCLLLD